MKRRTQKSEIEALEPAEPIEAALGLPAGFLASKRADDDGPVFYRLGRRTIRYRRSEVLAWIAQCQREPAARSAAAGQHQGAPG